MAGRFVKVHLSETESSYVSLPEKTTKIGGWHVFLHADRSASTPTPDKPESKEMHFNAECAEIAEGSNCQSLRLESFVYLPKSGTALKITQTLQ